MCRSERARFTQALNWPFDAYMAHALALRVLISSRACARASSNSRPMWSNHSNQLATRRNVQSGHLTRLENSSKIAPLAEMSAAGENSSVCAVRRDRVLDNSRQQPSLPLTAEGLRRELCGACPGSQRYPRSQRRSEF